MVNNKQISAIVIAKNVEKKIGKFLESLRWADELVVIDTGSTDKTKETASKHNAKVYTFAKGSFPDWRNYGREKANCDFLFYLDTDEVVNDELKSEILETVKNWPAGVACFAIPRKNVIFGKVMMHGGWYPDYVIRLFEKGRLIRWVGDLHEQPQYRGGLKYTKNTIIHYKENSLAEMLEKTNKRSEIEARLMFDANHPPMTVLRFMTAMCREFFFRFVKNAAFLDGRKGIIMGIYQVYSRFISYAKLWEMQMKNEKKD
ncbi:MAG: Glycosyl transferase family 2 [Candidatus Woesebacteria bacterium GW2011_GWA1_39_21]|uniref:Glycosyl transferase family 2 n=1 Tax=Candidatus Woesebacteria bacterium GW2011_GWA1_39_21 TaxID=1618550 RepID=A0A0G0N7L5_9BACT|nr:MAG: Glycosyl transferase family 2 [Candidatus Woesebacteria bacterium GW2011_GWA1_39_21]